jgi:hypothetical protein
LEQLNVEPAKEASVPNPPRTSNELVVSTKDTTSTIKLNYLKCLRLE